MGEARIEFLEKVASKSYNEWLIDGCETLEGIKGIPILNKLIIGLGDKHNGKQHGGQIIPLDDVLEVLELCENPAVMSCVCQEFIGKEKYCCLSLGLIPELYKKANPDAYMEELSLNKAKRMLSDWNEEGFYHQIIWSNIPYVTTICSCSNPYCANYKTRFFSGSKNTLIKGEYIARVDENLCTGCKKCLMRCQFGAIYFNVDSKKAFINIRNCFGCGLCITGCEENAVKLIERTLTPAKNLW
jgi:NAD-dependent dihydropyrimidine dehydrogenase PreA subunit